jgi:hypothetical protein
VSVNCEDAEKLDRFVCPPPPYSSVSISVCRYQDSGSDEEPRRSWRSEQHGGLSGEEIVLIPAGMERRAQGVGGSKSLMGEPSDVKGGRAPG